MLRWMVVANLSGAGVLDGLQLFGIPLVKVDVLPPPCFQTVVGQGNLRQTHLFPLASEVEKRYAPAIENAPLLDVGVAAVGNLRQGRMQPNKPAHVVLEQNKRLQPIPCGVRRRVVAMLLLGLSFISAVS